MTTAAPPPADAAPPPADAAPPPDADDAADVFDVAFERRRLILSTQRAWQPKRTKLDAELRAQLSKALSLADPAASNAALQELEQLISKRKLATAHAQAPTMQSLARDRFGTSRLYNIIYADPPWRYECTEHACGTATRYDTMSDTELAALPVAGLAATDAVLVMWATFHKLDAAVSLFAAWGFKLLTVLFNWVKVDRAGNPIYSFGAFTMPCAEFALLGTRGSMQVKQRKAIIGSVLRARPRGHSRKPAIVGDMIVRIWGDFPRIELFARRSPPDWDVWGNQTTRYANEAEEKPAAGADADADADEDDAEDDGEIAGFLPRRIDRVKMNRDRFMRIERRGAAGSFAGVTVGTSFGRLDHEFDAETQEPRIWRAAAEDDHDHDGTRPCCRPLDELDATAEGEVARNTTLLTAYMRGHRGGLAALRNTLYSNSSEATVRARAADLRAQQTHNADMLFAINHNAGRRKRERVRVTAPPSPPPARKRARPTE